MSHKATMWAIAQRGIRPAAKLVLWHLCDRYHPDNGCFPSQETLADDCELSRSSLNDQIAALEAAGLIRREQRRAEGTNRQQSTRYRFSFEDDFEPCPNSGHGAVSENQAEPCPNFAPSRVRNSDTNLVREPVKEPIERERAQEDFEKARRAWPSGFADSREEAWAAWLSLSQDERSEGAGEIPRFIAATRSAGRTLFCGFAVYLRERKWKALPERPKPIARREGGGTTPPSCAAPKPTKFMLAHPELYPDLLPAKGDTVSPLDDSERAA